MISIYSITFTDFRPKTHILLRHIFQLCIKELIEKLGNVELANEDDPDFLFKMPAENKNANVKELGYEIFMSEEKGRGIRATKDFNVGNLMIQAEPYAYVIFEAMAEHVCHQCFNMVIRDRQGKPTNTLLRCASCKFARYCSRECQKKAWKTHKKECMAIKVWDSPKNSIFDENVINFLNKITID